MKRSHTARMTSVYFAFDFSRGYYYAGFFGYVKYPAAVEDRYRRCVLDVL